MPPLIVRLPYVPSVSDMPSVTTTELRGSHSGNGSGNWQMGDDSRSGISGGCGSRIFWLATVPHPFSGPGKVSAKSAAHVEGVSSFTMRAAITPSCSFSSKGASG
jgi:hypothetical protein